MKLSCIIVDDEPLARALLLDNIRRIPYLDFKADFNSAIEAKNYLSKHKIDLIFLDIQMPKMNGIDLAKTINDSMVIFTTAYDEYALEGFEVSAVDYILKPIMQERFEKACAKAKEYHDFKTGKTKNQPHVFIRADHQTVKVMLDDIIYIEGLKDYVKVHTKTNTKPLITRTNLKGIGELINSKKFMRVHKSYIANMELIQSVQNDSLIVGAIKIPLGEAYKAIIKENFK